ncbi:hypothetical protein [Anaerotignum sp.]|uniref:hypothetical protein n=1 Tax=Anaerotignum sp. TaxID=2039241 RepID=UPI0028A6F574|nr:hypothetical protein [Anaerotignum sp.]
MDRQMMKELIKFLILLFLCRGVLVYFSGDSFIDSGFVGLVIGCVLGRIIFLNKK